MYQRIRKHLTPSTIIAFAALVFALTGGAFAAGSHGGSRAKPTASTGGGEGVANSLLATAAKAKPKTKTGPRGPAGPKGAVGPAGPVGPAGAAGAKGENGAPGINGMNGKNGEAGKEGKKGEEGKEGSPWTDNGTLPVGSSERGQWAYGSNGNTPSFVYVGLSFTIPLAAPLGENEVHFIGREEGAGESSEATAIKNGECTGTWKEPGAKSGNLCVFLNVLAGAAGPGKLLIGDAETEGHGGAGISGAILHEADTEGGPVIYQGTWVVTG